MFPTRMGGMGEVPDRARPWILINNYEYRGPYFGHSVSLPMMFSKLTVNVRRLIIPGFSEKVSLLL